MTARIAALQRERLAAAALLVALSLALLAAGSARTFGLFTGSTTNPANTLATATSLWFDANGVAASICTGTNASLACAFGNRGRPVTVTATSSLKNKNGASNTFTLAVVNGIGPAGISTIVTVTFASNGAASATLATGATDTVNVQLKTKGGTAVGTYTGTILVTDTTTGRSTSIPLSVTVQ